MRKFAMALTMILVGVPLAVGEDLDWMNSIPSQFSLVHGKEPILVACTDRRGRIQEYKGVFVEQNRRSLTLYYLTSQAKGLDKIESRRIRGKCSIVPNFFGEGHGGLIGIRNPN